MTKLIEKDDPLYFGQTSNKPYDRHHYKIVCQNKSFVVESWDEVQEWWWNNCRSPWFEGTVIHIIADIICIPFYIHNKQWDVAIMLAFLMSIAISKVAILL